MLGARATPDVPRDRLLLDPATCCCSTPTASPRPGPRTRPFGEFGFAELLGTLAGEPPQAVVDAVERPRWSTPTTGEPRDDIALLALGLAA